MHRDYFEVYKSQKKWDKGERDRAVYDDGRLRKKY